MIAAPQGRSGKTTVAIGLCAALRKRGLQVKPFKKGPDYIDPSWLAAAAKSASGCTNLDTFLFQQAVLAPGFQRSCEGADVAVVEASMGLYDSSFEDGKGSSAWLSRHLQLPVILVVNCARMTRSAAAMVSGYMNFERGTNIAGVILNNISGKRHAGTITRAIEQYCGIPVIGILPKNNSLNIPERHLGIMPVREHSESEETIRQISDFFESNTDIARILQIAASAPDLPDLHEKVLKPVKPVAKIGVLSDRVFTFYYPENIKALETAGAELINIDSLHDKNLPDIDALYIGGGFPELYASELEANITLRMDIAKSAADGLPIYAECAGLMYLCRSINTAHGSYEMCGIFNADISIEKKPLGHGYVISEIMRDNPFFTTGSMIYGHEFHYSRLNFAETPEFASRMRRGFGVNGITDGLVVNNVFASYAHIHSWGVPEWAPALVKSAVTRRKETSKIKV